MKRNQKFRHNDRRYQFLDWANDGTAHCIDVEKNCEVWLSGIGKDIATQKQKEKSKLVDQSGFQLDAEIKRHVKLTDRLRMEADELFRTVPALTELAKHSLDATALGNLLHSNGDDHKSDDTPN